MIDDCAQCDPGFVAQIAGNLKTPAGGPGPPLAAGLNDEHCPRLPSQARAGDGMALPLLRPHSPPLLELAPRQNGPTICRGHVLHVYVLPISC